LTVASICDGHDSAILTINMEFIRIGIEVIYLGYHRSARDIARAAIQENVRAIGISSYNGGHVEFFRGARASSKETRAISEYLAEEEARLRKRMPPSCSGEGGSHFLRGNAIR
jgi:methylmalonyl-CoA mutase cobalamin-binding subunit